MTAYGGIETGCRGNEAWRIQYITKPFNLDEIISILTMIAQQRLRRKQVPALELKVYGLKNCGKSKEIQKVLDRFQERLAPPRC